MRVLIDENMSSRRLAARLQSVGHDVLLASDIGPGLVSDARVLAWAVAQDRPVLTRDHEDFADPHDLVLAVVGHHPGILVVRFDKDWKRARSYLLILAPSPFLLRCSEQRFAIIEFTFLPKSWHRIGSYDAEVR